MKNVPMPLNFILKQPICKSTTDDVVFDISGEAFGKSIEKQQ